MNGFAGGSKRTFTTLKFLNRHIVLLSVVSLLADLASLTAGLTRGYFGKQSDAIGLRLPFVRLGYLLSALSKPGLALMAQPLWIFFLRTLDRLGKGLRSAPRNALLAEASTPETRARVFGFHLALDTLGAALGPVAALVLLHLYPGNYRLLFLIAGVPGLLSVALLFALREPRRPRSTLRPGGFFSYLRYWQAAPKTFRRMAAPLLLFALFNFSDVFLLLRAREVTGSDTLTLTLYIGYNLLFALVALPAGTLADRWGPLAPFHPGIFPRPVALLPRAIGTPWHILLYGLSSTALLVRRSCPAAAAAPDGWPACSSIFSDIHHRQYLRLGPGCRLRTADAVRIPSPPRPAHPSPPAGTAADAPLPCSWNRTAYGL